MINWLELKNFHYSIRFKYHSTYDDDITNDTLTILNMVSVRSANKCSFDGFFFLFCFLIILKWVQRAHLSFCVVIKKTTFDECCFHTVQHPFTDYKFIGKFILMKTHLHCLPRPKEVRSLIVDITLQRFIITLRNYRTTTSVILISPICFSR